MTKLPPGFSHELYQHVKTSPIDPSIGLPVLDFNDFCCGSHGLGLLLETQCEGDENPTYTLFDTGPDRQSLVHNLATFNVSASSISRVVLSHWHSDHSSGIVPFLKARGTSASSPCIVNVHPDRPLARGIAPGPDFKKCMCAMPPDPTISEIEAAGGVIECHSKGHAVAHETVWISGEIPRYTDFENGILGHMRLSEHGGAWVNEQHVMDERYAVVDVYGKGLIIFSACSHAGIVNVVRDAVLTFSRPVYMVVGGLHLAGPEFAPRIPRTVDFLSNQLRPAPTYVLPMHCTGFQAKIALEKAFGEGCVPAGAGHKIDVLGNRDGDDRLFYEILEK
ncbi:hypothetical protein FISHEDRAFT_68341 [Fistulina hepatica ATCC 64428]|uniref:Metallo-beta-lactamase domain-containing protein n=1 Tax=Fistulina hepatica ATCC 64428 TaxID=1128425 RepID=A0A0D7AQF1_9AGAR|nr:hypothetical protein FISHEDRAFT_68341 [Fistulina hepatica ATCC 64428]